MVGCNLHAKGLDDLRLGLRQVAKQVLQLDVLYFVGGMLVETLPVAGDLNELIELIHRLIHDTSCMVATDSPHARSARSDALCSGSQAPCQAGASASGNQISHLGDAIAGVGVQHAGTPC